MTDELENGADEDSHKDKHAIHVLEPAIHDTEPHVNDPEIHVPKIEPHVTDIETQVSKPGTQASIEHNIGLRKFSGIYPKTSASLLNDEDF